MSDQPTNEEEKQQDTEAKRNPRLIQSELLKKIYYPDTLYPDNYAFFSEREPLRQSPNLDGNDQQTTTDSARTTTLSTRIPPQIVVELETPEQFHRHSVSVVCTFTRHNVLFVKFQCHFTRTYIRSKRNEYKEHVE